MYIYYFCLYLLINNGYEKNKIPHILYEIEFSIIYYYYYIKLIFLKSTKILKSILPPTLSFIVPPPSKHDLAVIAFEHGGYFLE